MKNYLLITLIFFLISCKNDLDEDIVIFSEIPEITLENFEFKETLQNSEPDTLKISITYRDQEGDLGLENNEVNAPYNRRNYFSNKTGQLFDFGNENIADILTIKNLQDIDTLPPYEFEAICKHWDKYPELYLNDGTQLDDTVYFQFNPYHYNIQVDFFLESTNGNFELFDWNSLQFDCSTSYDGRFPIVNSCDNCTFIIENAFIIQRMSKSVGIITYNMLGVGFKPVFKGKKIKLRVRIIDRALHISNTIETPILQF